VGELFDKNKKKMVFGIMRHYLKSVCVGLMILIMGVGLAGCGRMNKEPGLGPDYFTIMKSPTNYKIEYKYFDGSSTEYSTTEIRVDNKVYFLGNSIVVYSKSDKKIKREDLGMASRFCWNTYRYRGDKNIAHDEKQQYTATFLERQVTVFTWIRSVTLYSGEVNVARSEFYVDNEYDVVLKCNHYVSYSGGEEQHNIMFEATLFVVGGQSVPTL